MLRVTTSLPWVIAVVCFPFFGTRVLGDAIQLTNLWSVEIKTKSDSTAAIGDDGTVYFGTFSGRLWALRRDGSTKWVFRVGIEIKSSPAVALDGTVFFGSRDRRIYAVGADGRQRWRFKTGGWVDSSPALARDGTVYVGSWDGKFYALRPDGLMTWQFPTGGAIVCSPAVGLDGTIYFGSRDRKFYALTPAGKKKWEYAVGGQILSSPAINGDECVYFTAMDGFLYALNLDGSLRWRLKSGGATESSPVLGEDGTIYVGVNHELWAVTPDGKLRWPRGFEDMIEDTHVALSQSLVTCISRFGGLLALDPEREPVWGYYLYTSGYASPGIDNDGNMYIADHYTKFTAIPTRVHLARSPWPKFRGNCRNTGNAADNAP